jgi:ligand-binding sensor domain-containing protein/two-component sensor histidine kinase
MHFFRTHLLCFRAVLLLLILASTAAPGYGKVEIIDGNNGLSNSIVTAIIKDQRGLMWIGTRNGLNLYDGYSFTKPFRELANLPVTKLVYDDKLNVVWVGTDKGLYIILLNYGAVHYLDANSEWGRHGVSSILIMRGHHVYVAYNNGALVAFDGGYTPRLVLRLQPKDKYNLVYIRDMIPQTDSSLIFLTYEDRAMYRLSLRSNKLDTVRIGDKKLLPVFIQAGRDVMLVGSIAHGLQLIDINTFADITPSFLRQFNSMEKGSLQAIVYGDTCYAIYGYFNHYLINLKQETISPVVQTAERRNDWRANNCIFRDEQGIIWIGTEVGIAKIIEERNLFGQILDDLHYASSVRGIVEDEAGDLYVGSYKGLYHYSKKWAQWHQYLPPSLSESSNWPAVPFALLNDTSGYIYLADQYPPLSRFNKKTKAIESDFYKASPVASTLRGYALFRDPEGKIWLGSNKGLLTYSPLSQELIYHQNDRFDIGKCIVRQIRDGREKEILWVATDKGLFKIHREKGVEAHYRAGSVPDLSSSDLYCVFEDEQGKLWLGTNGSGINIISADRKSVHSLNKSHDGLTNDIVYAMLRYKDKIWISTFNGMSCYDLRQETFTNYYTTDGLSDNQFNWSSFFMDQSGKIFFGGINGINAFYPDSLEQIVYEQPRLFVSPVSRWSSETGTFTTINDVDGNGDRITLNSPNASLVFNLGLTDYTEPVNNRFSYRVRGLFDEWIPLSGSVLQMNGIPYGKYRVEIKAMNSRGIPAVNTLVFYLHVKLPFYKTWWFYSLIAFFAVALIFVFFLIKYRNLKNMQRLRLRIASDLHDEVGSVLTEITLLSENLWLAGSVRAEEHERLQKITSLSREATSSMSDILWTIDVRNDFAGSMADRMREHAEALLLPANIELHFDAGEVQHKQKMPAEVRQQLYLIFKEALNNVARHAQATEVKIIYRYDHDGFFLSIVNDGVGTIEPDGTGQGLANMKMRAEGIGAVMRWECAHGIFSVTVERRKNIA